MFLKFSFNHIVVMDKLTLGFDKQMATAVVIFKLCHPYFGFIDARFPNFPITSFKISFQVVYELFNLKENIEQTFGITIVFLSFMRQMSSCTCMAIIGIQRTFV